MKISMRSALLSSTLALAPAWTSYADEGDSSADIPSGYAEQVKESHGVVIKVPMDANGNVFTDAAELRIVTVPDEATSGAEAKSLWDSYSVETPKVAADAGDSDSSTLGSWRSGWNWGYRNGWQPSRYYYNNYYPAWNYRGYNYNYYRPNYYNNYNPYYRGYGYYYYPRRR